jgi:hypothetical protein
MTNHEQAARRAKKQLAVCPICAAGGVCPEFVCQFARAVIEMAEERDTVMPVVEEKLGKQRERIQQLEAQLATARKLIVGARRLHKLYLPAHWQEEADRFLNETERDDPEAR